jgi:EAL domain-containing protein (putative c-di-GMP-specific phosphodiesterase class I)
MTMIQARPEPERLRLTGGSLATALFEAIRLDQIEVYYQPIVTTDGGRVTGAEALLRWHHPTAGLLTAASFAHVAEQTGMLGLLGRRALTTACIAASTWTLPPAFRMQVNANVQQLSSRTFLGDVRQALRTSGLEPERLAIEITETVRLPANGQVLQNLNGLRAMGVAIELDDFGTGYCSPLYLKQLPVTGIKLDQQFVSGLGLEASDDTIVAHLASMATKLGLTVCGEGVEHAQQQQCLIDYGVTSAQGWLFSPAVCRDDFHLLLQNWHAD